MWEPKESWKLHRREQRSIHGVTTMLLSAARPSRLESVLPQDGSCVATGCCGPYTAEVAGVLRAVQEKPPGSPSSGCRASPTNAPRSCRSGVYLLRGVPARHGESALVPKMPDFLSARYCARAPARAVSRSHAKGKVIVGEGAPRCFYQFLSNCGQCASLPVHFPQPVMGGMLPPISCSCEESNVKPTWT